MHGIARKPQGFTLIEIMVVVAIIALLAGIALPSYTKYVARGKRADARSTMLEAAQFMERQYSVQNQYAASLPARLQFTPATGTKAYTLTVTATVSAYTITATPVASDDCGNLLLSHTGKKSRSGTALSEADCWK